MRTSAPDASDTHPDTHDAPDDAGIIRADYACIEPRVAQIVCQHLGLDPAAVEPGANLMHLGADSLDGLEIELALEDEFGIELAALPDLATIKAVSETVEHALRAQRREAQLAKCRGD